MYAECEYFRDAVKKSLVAGFLILLCGLNVDGQEGKKKSVKFAAFLKIRTDTFRILKISYSFNVLASC